MASSCACVVILHLFIILQRVCVCVRGSSTVDLLIYQTLCYAQDDLDRVNVDDYLLKVCGHDEFLHK